MSDRDRLAAFEAGFHRATHVIAALLLAVLITQVDLHSRDVIADSAQSTLDYVTDLSGQRLMTFDVTIGVDLDLHGVLFISVVDSILPIPHSLPLTGKRLENRGFSSECLSLRYPAASCGASSLPVGSNQSRPLRYPLGRNQQGPVAQLFDQLAQSVE